METEVIFVISWTASMKPKTDCVFVSRESNLIERTRVNLHLMILGATFESSHWVEKLTEPDKNVF